MEIEAITRYVKIRIKFSLTNVNCFRLVNIFI